MQFSDTYRGAVFLSAIEDFLFRVFVIAQYCAGTHVSISEIKCSYIGMIGLLYNRPSRGVH